MAKREPLYLIDGSGYIFRAYYAVRRLTTSAGMSTNAVFGFTNMLLRVLREHTPTHVAIAFDAGGKTFRHERYPAYKANRPPPPEDLPPQLPLIGDMVDAFRIVQYRERGVEADDVIGTLARRAEAAGHDVRIITGDKDFMQLVDDRVLLIDELRLQRASTEHPIVDAAEVERKFGVPPRYVVDVLALAGDSSDNVPGVKGIGEKTAAELVKEYGDVDAILAHADEIKQKARRERLKEGAENARLSKELVTIRTDLDLPFELERFRYPGPDRERLRALFTELEFKRLLDDAILKEPTPPTTKPGARGAAKGAVAKGAGGQGDLFAAPADAEPAPAPTLVLDRARTAVVTDPTALHALTGALARASTVAAAVVADEEPGAAPVLVGIALAPDGERAHYVPLAPAVAGLAPEEVRAALAPLFARTGLVVEDGKNVLRLLAEAGLADARVVEDPQVASYLLDPEANGHGLDAIAERRFGYHALTRDAVCGKGKTLVPAARVDVDALAAFAGERALLAARAAPELAHDVDEAAMGPLYRDLELPLERVLAEMERTGILVDTARLGGLSADFEVELARIEGAAHDAAGEAFNLASPPQIAQLLFEKLSLAPKKKTKTGLSTDASVLEELKDEHPLPGLILEHRELAKLKGTYVDALPRLVRPDTGRIHTRFHQTVAATGRLSSSDPNLQNIPVRTAIGRKIREAFVAPKGRTLVSLDYSQIELRLLAHVSGDPVLIDTFEKGEDVHQRTAAEIFGVGLDDVTREQRTAAKAINFGLLYGMGVHRLAGELGIKRTEAKQFLDRYFERYAGISSWKSEALQSAMADQAVRTLFGRRRLLPQLSSQNRGEVALGERLAINTPIQGSAADLIKRAMVDAWRTLARELPSARLVLQVHDELLVEADAADADAVIAVVRAAMEGAASLRVPLVVDARAGASWAEIH